MAKGPGRSHQPRRMRGFEPTAGLLRDRIRTAGESRGFAVARLLTHWSEIVGEEIARHARPVRVGYRRDGFGATLTLLTTGAHAPMIEMQKDTIRDRVNACYGYAAISRIALTQTAPDGFAEGRAAFAPRPSEADVPRAPDPAATRRAAEAAAGVADPGLRAALERLGQRVFTGADGSAH